jgi:hypothetical protein
MCKTLRFDGDVVERTMSPDPTGTPFEVACQFLTQPVGMCRSGGAGRWEDCDDDVRLSVYERTVELRRERRWRKPRPCFKRTLLGEFTIADFRDVDVGGIAAAARRAAAPLATAV